MVGDPHVTTFDGKGYSMYGKCSYVLSEHCHYGSGNKLYEIELQNSDCKEYQQGLMACTRQLIMKLYGGPVITLGSSKNAASQYTPTVLVNGNGADRYVDETVELEFVGRENVIVHSKAGVSVQWTGHNVYVTVGPSLENKTCGLCGTFNHEVADDFHTRSDDIAAKASAFANEWATEESKASVPSCNKHDWDTIEGKVCDLYSVNDGYATQQCNIIKDSTGPFKDCDVDKDQYYHQCKTDGCKCKDCLCYVVAAYAKACADKGIVVEGWRSKMDKCSESTLFVFLRELIQCFISVVCC